MYHPFWSFFEAINDEVDQFNHMLTSNGFQDRKKKSQPQKAIASSGGCPLNQVSCRQNQSNLLPSLFHKSLFDHSDPFDIVPPVDIHDNEKNYELHVSIPGVPKEMINLDFDSDRNEIKINGEIPSTTSADDNVNSKVIERASGKFERVIRLSKASKLDEQNIKATYKDGVLNLIIPKLEKAEPTSRRILISSL